MAETYASYPLTEEMLRAAYERAKALPEYEYSHRKLQANFVGCIGELVMGDFFRRKGVQFSDDRHQTTHDFLVSNGITLDVKTKDRTVKPRRNYDNSVPLYNHEHQRPDYYYFVSLLRNRKRPVVDIYRFSHAFIVGGLDIATWEAKGRVWEADETDPDNGTTFWISCINVSMVDLLSNKEMLSIFRAAAKPDGTANRTVS